MLLQYSPTTVIEFDDEDVADFWSRMDRSGGPDSCWEWQGSLKAVNGYGRLIRGDNQHFLIHRIAYVLTYGPLGDLCALHHCDNPPCGNPRHLYAGTKQDNANDRVARGRINHHGGIPCRGELNGLAKLTATDVRAIRLAYEGGAKGVDLARHYGVRPSNISMIVLRRTWRHIE